MAKTGSRGPPSADDGAIHPDYSLSEIEGQVVLPHVSDSNKRDLKCLAEIWRCGFYKTGENSLQYMGPNFVIP